MRPRRRVLVLRLALWLAAALVAGCGDDGPSTGPTPTSVARPTVAASLLPAGTVLRFVSGESESPVPGAEVVMGDARYQTDDSGSISLSRGYDRGALVDVLASGFLDRQTLVRASGDTRFTLWPRQTDSGLNEDFTREILYDTGDGTLRGLIRVNPRVDVAYVVPSEQIRNDVRAMRMVEEASRTISDATRGALSFLVAEQAPSGSVAFELVVDPADPDLVDAVAVAKRRFSGFAIVGGTAVFDSIERVRTSTTTHELGHMFGFGHTNGTKDIMNTYRRRGTVERFSEREELAMRLVLLRAPRNEFPDNDRSVTAPLTLSAPEGSVSIVRCWN